MQGYAIRSVTVSGASVVNAHSVGQGLATSLVALASRARDTENPSLASASARLRLAGVTRFNVPSSSSVLQRPQLESSVCQRKYSAGVTRGWGEACCARTLPPGRASIARMTPVRVRAKLPTIRVLIATSRYRINSSNTPNKVMTIPDRDKAHARARVHHQEYEDRRQEHHLQKDYDEQTNRGRGPTGNRQVGTHANCDYCRQQHQAQNTERDRGGQEPHADDVDEHGHRAKSVHNQRVEVHLGRPHQSLTAR